MFVRVTPREAKSLLDLPACKKNVSRLTWQPWCGYIYRWQARKFIQISFTPPGEWGAGGWIHRFSTKHSAKQSVELMDLEAQRTSYLQFDWKTFLCFVAGINAKREEKKNRKHIGKRVHPWDCNDTICHATDSIRACTIIRIFMSFRWISLSHITHVPFQLSARIGAFNYKCFGCYDFNCFAATMPSREWWHPTSEHGVL